MNQRAILSEFQKLSLTEKSQLLDVLWEDYAREEELRQLTDDEARELERRMSAYRADPSVAISSAEVFREMRERISAHE
jgi:putative addiction module component (TIGR02574 family)